MRECKRDKIRKYKKEIPCQIGRGFDGLFNHGYLRASTMESES